MGIKDYINNLISLIKLEREAQMKIMEEEMKRLSGKEREKMGRAILDLKGKIIGFEFDFKLVKFFRERPIETEIEVGDLVLVSATDPKFGGEIGTVAEKRKSSIVVALEFVPEEILKKARIDLYVNDVTFSRQIENLKKLNFFGIRVLKFLLKKEWPKQSHFIYFVPENKNLNKSQKRAVGFALGSKDFFLIHGPFGTGKTTTLIELILQEVKRKKKVLATAESNVAVDNIVEGLYKKANIVRIGHPSRIAKHLKETSIFNLIQFHPHYLAVKELKKKMEEIKIARDKFLRPTTKERRGLSFSEILNLARKKETKRGILKENIEGMAKWIVLNREFQKIFQIIKRIENFIAKEIVEKAEVVLSTNSSAGWEILDEVFFDVAIVDEASQATIPSVLIPISKAKKFILVGDHKQLPPTIFNLKAKELEKTLFEELISNFPKKSQLLNLQYRMNKVLMEFPNLEFYGGKIKSASGASNINLEDLKIKRLNFFDIFDEILNPKLPLVFLDTARIPEKFEKQREGSVSRENPLEAFLVKEIIERLFKMKIKPRLIGVITPYDDQVKLLRETLKEKVEIHSVDSFQGREKEIIIVSFVRANKEKEIGFLKDLRRLNVTLTRAKRKMILIGDSETLNSHPVYWRLINFSQKNGGYFLLKENLVSSR